MPDHGFLTRVLVSLLFLAAGMPGLRADTVILKNGRRIVAEKVSRENGKVICETPSGRLALPESIVARIETDHAGAPSALNLPAANLEFKPPALDEIGEPGSNEVIRNGAIDGDVLARLEAAAGGDA